MSRCYNFIGTEKHGQYIACLPDNSPINPKLVSWEVAELLAKNRNFPCELVLKPFKDKYKDYPAEWHDYMYNQYAFFMVSERLKNFLEERRTEDDSFEWINVKVRHEDIVKDYYIIVFPKLLDVVDKKNTSYYLEGTTILIQCFAYEKIEKFSVFPLNNDSPCFPSLLYTTEKIKKEIQKEKFSNLKFEKCKTSVNGVVENKK